MGLLSLVPAGYRLIALALAFLAAFAAGWVKGNDHGTRKLTEYIGKQAVEAVRIVTARSAVTAKVVTKYREVAGKTEIVTVTLVKEVDRYAQTNAGSCLDFGWGRLHDAAAANRLPDPRPPASDPVRAPPAAPPGGGSRITEGGGGAGDRERELRQASSLR